jgi:hypothetical protein
MDKASALPATLQEAVIHFSGYENWGITRCGMNWTIGPAVACGEAAEAFWDSSTRTEAVGLTLGFGAIEWGLATDCLRSSSIRRWISLWRRKHFLHGVLEARERHWAGHVFRPS